MNKVNNDNYLNEGLNTLAQPNWEVLGVQSARGVDKTPKNLKGWTSKELKSYFPKSAEFPADLPVIKESIDRVFRRLVPLDNKFFSDRRKYNSEIDTIAVEMEYDRFYIEEAVDICIEIAKPICGVTVYKFPYAYFDKILKGTMALNKPTSHKSIMDQWCAHMGTTIPGERPKLQMTRKDRTKFNELWAKYFPKVDEALTAAAISLGKREEVPAFTIENPPVVSKQAEIDQDLIDFAETFRDDTGLQSIFDEAIVDEARLVLPDQGSVSISDGTEEICRGIVFAPQPTAEAIENERKLLEANPNEFALANAVPNPACFESYKPEHCVIDIFPCKDSIFVEIEKEFCPENLILVKYPSSLFFTICAVVSFVLLITAPILLELFGWYGLIPVALSTVSICVGFLYMLFVTLYLTASDYKHKELLRARRIRPSYMIDSTYLTMEFQQGEDHDVGLAWDARPVALKQGALEEDNMKYIYREAKIKIYSNTKPDSWIVRLFLKYGLAKKFWNLSSVHKYSMNFLPELLQDVLDIKALQALSMTEYVARVKQIMASAVHFNYDKTKILDYENLAMNTYIVAAIIKKNDENKRLGNFHRGLWTQVPVPSTV
jgi:hypothetical protein